MGPAGLPVLPPGGFIERRIGQLRTRILSPASGSDFSALLLSGFAGSFLLSAFRRVRPFDLGLLNPSPLLASRKDRFHNIGFWIFKA